MTREILDHFQGKRNVTKIISDNGLVSYLTPSRSFADEASSLGASKLNTVENENKHVLFLFNKNDEEVGRYYIGKRLQGKTPSDIVIIKNNLVFFDAWNPNTKKWVPCIGMANYNIKRKYGCGLLTILQDNKWRVEDTNSNIIVPPGKYDYIDGFDVCGLARVKRDGKTDIDNPSKSTKDVWGIINTKGEEVLELKYSQIWVFYTKNRKTTKVFREYEIENENGKITDWGNIEYEFDLYKLQLIEKVEEASSDYYSWEDAYEDDEEAAAANDYEW